MPTNPSNHSYAERQPSQEAEAVSSYAHYVISPAVERTVGVIDRVLAQFPAEITPPVITYTVPYTAEAPVLTDQTQQASPTYDARRAVDEAFGG